MLTFSENNSQSLVLVDLSTTNDVDMENLKSIFEGKLRMEQLGPYQVKVAGQNWWRIIPGKSKILKFESGPIAPQNVQRGLVSVLIFRFSNF